MTNTSISDIQEDDTIIGMHNMLNDIPLTPGQKKALIISMKKQAALVEEWENFQKKIESRWLLIQRGIYAGGSVFIIYLPTTFRKIAQFFNWLAGVVERLV